MAAISKNHKMAAITPRFNKETCDQNWSTTNDGSVFNLNMFFIILDDNHGQKQ